MKRLTLAIFLFAATIANAQPKNPIVTEARFPWSVVRANLLKMANKMPPELYTYRPVPDVESFAQRIIHIAWSNLNVCNGLLKKTGSTTRPTGTAKAEMVALLTSSIAACDEAFDATNDQNAFEQFNSRLGGPFPPEPTRSRLATLNNMVRHSNEVYGYLCVYLRLNGIVPPSSLPE